MSRPRTLPAPNDRILVIDDHPSIHQDFRKILCPGHLTEVTLEEDEVGLFGEEMQEPKATQFVIDSAFQGKEGLAMVQQALAEGRPYALAFVDVRMPPGWDGIETISALWACDPELQVVICSAYSDYCWDELEKKLGRSHNLVILKKPFDNIEVLQLAHALTQKWLLAQQEKTKLQELNESCSLLLATLESTADGILVVDNTGKMVGHNAQFVQLWRLPNDVLVARDDPGAWQLLLDQLDNPENFLAQVQHLFTKPEAESFDVL